MSSFTITNSPSGNVYDSDEFLREVISLAQLLAKNARLAVPLAKDTDLSDAECKETQQQIHALSALPPFAVFDFWTAFAAYHLPRLASSILSHSHSTQRRALSTHIQILSLLPPPDAEPYFRRFITSPVSRGIATRVVDSFIQGIDWQRPSGPGQICALIKHLLIWGDASESPDGKAPISSDVRDPLARKLEVLTGFPQFFSSLPESQRAEITGLRDVLATIAASEGNAYLASMREDLETRMVDRCAKGECTGNAELRCAGCKSVRYCGKECQRWHWKNGHKLRCHKIRIFRSIEI